jgi:hypothetical protein
VRARNPDPGSAWVRDDNGHRVGVIDLVHKSKLVALLRTL